MLTVGFAPVLGVGGFFDKCNGNVLPIGKIMKLKNILRTYLTIYLQHLHLFALQI